MTKTFTSSCYSKEDKRHKSGIVTYILRTYWIQFDKFDEQNKI